MVFQVYFGENIDTDRRKVLFDIEFYLTYYTNNDDEKLWYSEIRTLPIAENFVDYVLQNKSFSDDKWNKFKKYCENIEWLRGWLYEVNDNKSLPMKEASDRHYKNFLPKLKEMIHNFAKEFDLMINED